MHRQRTAVLAFNSMLVEGLGSVRPIGYMDGFASSKEAGHNSLYCLDALFNINSLE